MEKNKTSEDSIKILNRRSFIIIIFGAILSLIVSFENNQPILITSDVTNLENLRAVIND